MIPDNALPVGLKKMRPLPGQVYVERDEQPERSGNLIIIPNSYRRNVRSLFGTVVAAASRFLKVGDRVLMFHGIGRKLHFQDGTVWYVLRETEIQAKFNGQAEVEARPVRRELDADRVADLEDGAVDEGGPRG